MKSTLILLFLITSFNAWSLELKDIATDKSLRFKTSNGPKHKGKLIEHALEEWWNVTDVNNTIDDGLVHDIGDSCDPQDVYSVYEKEVDYGNHTIEFNFTAVKKGSKSIAYGLEPVVVYKIVFTVFETHADDKRNNQKTVSVDCPISSETLFYYKNTKDKSVAYLGNSEELNEITTTPEPQPELQFGVKVDGKLISTKDGALSLFNKFKNKEATDKSVCYFGNWEVAVESAHKSVELFVTNKVKQADRLEVEVEKNGSQEITSGTIPLCK